MVAELAPVAFFFVLVPAICALSGLTIYWWDKDRRR